MHHIEPDLFVFVFNDGSNNKIEITAPSKTQAKEQAKRMFMGGGVMRYVSHRPETPAERSARHGRDKKRAAEEEQKAATTPKIVRRRKAFGRNDRCPCGGGKKVKHCRCKGVGGAETKAGKEA